MTVGELKKILAGLEDDTSILLATQSSAMWSVDPLPQPELFLYDGQDIFDFDESKIDPGHLQKVLVFQWKIVELQACPAVMLL